MSIMTWVGDRIDINEALRLARIKKVSKYTKLGLYRFEDEYFSILGMMAFSVWSNLPLNLLTPDEESDFGQDFEINGFKIDIKSTQHMNGRLVYRWGTKHDADVYVLACVPVGKEEETILRGWAWRDELLAGEAKDWGNRGKPAITLTQDKLRPMDTLVQELKAYER